MNKTTQKLIKTKMSDNILTDFNMKYSMLSCQISDMSCSLSSDCMNYIKSSVTSEDNISACFPLYEEDGCRDFIVFVDQIGTGLTFVYPSGTSILIDEEQESDDMVYNPSEKAVYSLTEVNKDCYLMSKKVVKGINE